LDSFYFLAFIVLLPFLMTLAVPLAYKFMKEKVGWFAAAIAAVCFLLIVSIVPSIADGHNLAGAFHGFRDSPLILRFTPTGLPFF